MGVGYTYIYEAIKVYTAQKVWILNDFGLGFAIVFGDWVSFSF